MSRKLLVPFQLPADPVNPLEATTKQYVDSLTIVSATDPIAANPGCEIWIDTTTVAPTVPASSITFAPVGTIAATDVQSAVAEVANEAPRGVIAWKAGGVNGLALSATPVNIYTLAATLVLGRMYELRFSCRAFYGGTNSNFVHFGYTVSPTTGAVVTGNIDVYCYGPQNYGSVDWGAIIVPTVAGTYTYNITSYAGTSGLVWTDLGGIIRVTDLGPAIASS